MCGGEQKSMKKCGDFKEWVTVGRGSRREIQVDKEKRGTREAPLGQVEYNLKTRTGVCACGVWPTPRPA